MATVTQIKRAVTRLIKAEVDYAWRGAGHPEDIEPIEAERKAARKNYELQCDIIQRHLDAGGNRPDFRGLSLKREPR